jgi:hypothetical protein
MDVTCFKCGKGIHAPDATRATRKLALHLRSCHTITGPNEQLVCGQNGCQRTFNIMNSFLSHIRNKHLNQKLHADHHGIEQHPPDHNDPMETESDNSSDDDPVDEDASNYMETFSVANLKKLAFSMIMTLTHSHLLEK